jgi:YidC/Oxa1 family membrane protein insertase
MEKRLALALVLAGLILFTWNTWVQPPVPPARRAGADSAAVAGPRAAPAAAARTPAAPGGAVQVEDAIPARTVTVRSPLYEYRFSTRGAALEAASLLEYASYVQKGKPVQLVPENAGWVLSNRVVYPGGTLDLRTAAFQPSAESVVVDSGQTRELRFTYAPGGRPVAEIVYVFRADSYLVDVRGQVFGGRAGTLVTELGSGLAPHDAPEHAAERELAFVGWNADRIERIYLRKVAAEPDTVSGPLVWGGIKDRYFFLALIQQGDRRFTGLNVTPWPDERYAVGRDTLRSPRARGFLTSPLGTDGRFAFQAYLGPLEHDRLEAAGHQLEEVNPYGYRWLRPVIRPIAAAVLWVLNELHGTLGLAYGWVLVVFGVMVRIVTWPLNAKAMRAQMRNMAVQPQMQARMKEIQTRHAADPRKQQEEMVKMYQELGVSPFSMMSGCLPLLIPMPVLITLFFVFQGAIEFRGASFGWLPDLSLADPFYILPIFLVVSMFALQWVSTKLSGMEQNAQMQTMMYTMPLMMGIFFWWMPSGLNLYYASTNVASLPQQLLIARERRRAMEAQKAADAAKAKKPGAPKPPGSAGTKPAPKRKT